VKLDVLVVYIVCMYMVISSKQVERECTCMGMNAWGCLLIDMGSLLFFFLHKFHFLSVDFCF
jgi:hypothetical protein